LHASKQESGGQISGRLELFVMVERSSLWKRKAGLGDVMVMRWENGLHVEDMRNHPQELVRGLESLLLHGANLTPDPKHPGFFEIHSDAQVYYVHVVPNSDKVLLLATWTQNQELAAVCGLS
jgi:hypothetical protein